MFAWKALPLTRRMGFLGAVALLVAFCILAWPHPGSSGSLARQQLTIVSNATWVGALILTFIAPGHDRSFWTWPRVCRWLFAAGFAGQLVALVWMLTGR